MIGMYIGLQLSWGNKHSGLLYGNPWRRCSVQQLLSTATADTLHAYLVSTTPLSSPHASVRMRPLLLIETLFKRNSMSNNRYKAL